MIYLDASVVLAHLLSEDVRPPDSLWREPLIASRLMEYEVRNRLHALGIEREHPSMAAAVFNQISFVDLVEDVLAAAWDALPTGLRTLDALHLASAIFLREQGVELEVATYDRRFADAARQAGFEVMPLEG